MTPTIVSKGGPAPTYVVQRVLGAYPNTRVLRPVGGGTRKRAASRLDAARRAPLRGTSVLARRTFRQVQRRQRDRQGARLLFGDARVPPLPNAEPIASKALKHGTDLGPLQAQPPEVLVLANAPLLPPTVFTLPTVATVNLHLGISPDHRGEHTIFYALYRGDFDHVGATLHRVDEGIDTGPLLAHVHPALEPSDTEASVLANSARLSAEVLVDYLRAVEVGTAGPGIEQPGRGRYYRFDDRRVWHDAHHLLQRKVLRRRPPKRPPRGALLPRTSRAGAGAGPRPLISLEARAAGEGTDFYYA